MTMAIDQEALNVNELVDCMVIVLRASQRVRMVVNIIPMQQVSYYMTTKKGNERGEAGHCRLKGSPLYVYSTV